MAKEFKNYDELFKNNHAKTLINIERTHGKIASDDYFGKKSWAEFMPDWKYKVHSQSEVQIAVYHAEDASDWQFFRVGLKGLATDAKLYCLAWYYAQEGSITRRIRIDNYLGALIRGGQLNDKLEIVR
jgi:hypothetical protein